MLHPEFPYVALLAAVLVLVPLPWHWRAGNVATLSIIAWLFATDVIYGADAIVWGDNAIIVIPVWCDISECSSYSSEVCPSDSHLATKVIIGANIALPAACMCVCIHLKQVASIHNVKTSFQDKRRRQIIEAILCILLPMVWMAVRECTVFYF